MTDIPDQDVRDIGDALTGMGLADPGQKLLVTRLSGGVSCDVYRVDIGDRTLCLKRALTKLRVEADWRAPVERSSTEVAWLRLAGQIVPGAVPVIFGEDKARHMFAMEYFPAEDFPVWKACLAGGTIEPDFAADVGRTLVRIHAATAGGADIASDFANDAQFLALRLDPFLLYVAARHADIAQELRALSDSIASARIALMQGDVSPKNILRGAKGPVFLDAETACYGDPAFDLAFCLTHLLLKCAWHPQWTTQYLQCFGAMASAYCAGVVWETPDAPDRRAARILPALLLARVDGKSPVEYLTVDGKKTLVRTEAVAMLKDRMDSLDAISGRWARALAKAFPQPVHP